MPVAVGIDVAAAVFDHRLPNCCYLAVVLEVVDRNQSEKDRGHDSDCGYWNRSHRFVTERAAVAAVDGIVGWGMTATRVVGRIALEKQARWAKAVHIFCWSLERWSAGRARVNSLLLRRAIVADSDSVEMGLK